MTRAETTRAETTLAEITLGRNNPGPTQPIYTDFGRNCLNPKLLHIIMDIQNSIFGYPIVSMILGYP